MSDSFLSLPITARELAEAREDIGDLLSDTVTLTTFTQALNASGQKTFTPSATTALPARIFRSGGADATSTALGLSSEESYTILLPSTVTPRENDEVSASGEFSGLILLIKQVHPVRFGDGNTVWSECEAIRKRAA